MKTLLKVLIVICSGIITGFTPSLDIPPVYIPNAKDVVITFGNCSNPFINSSQFPHLSDLQSYQPTYSADGRYNNALFAS